MISPFIIEHLRQKENEKEESKPAYLELTLDPPPARGPAPTTPASSRGSVVIDLM